MYFFRSPNSYTGQDLVEIHLFASESVVEALLERVLGQSRLAEAGEFTLRAYLNGKIDLSQAEAVAAIVSGSNSFQLGAAERLLEGSLCKSIAEVREGMIQLMSMVEAGMDFSEEEIEIISQKQACGEIEVLVDQMEGIMDESVRYEEMIDMVSVGLAGAANVGKSSLLNKLLGMTRSIVADELGTTRDVLTGILELENVRCAVFDCAGVKNETQDQLEMLANKAAVESLKSAGVVLMCVDASRFDLEEVKLLAEQIGKGVTIFVLTKCDLVKEQQIEEIKRLTVDSWKQWAWAALPCQIVVVSSKTGEGVEELKKLIEKTIVDMQAGSQEATERIAINQRHKQTIQEAIRTLNDAKENLLSNCNEIAVMLLRGAYQSLGSVQNEHVDEKVLDRIFSQFCIGK